MLALLFALAAQDTTCVQTGAIIKCHSEPNGPADYGAAIRSGADSVPRYQAPPVDRAAILRRQVGGLIAKGDCAGAEKLALRGGDIGLAAEVRDYCAKR
jgi:hypothetical protein